MSLYYKIVFSILVTEMSILTILSLPLPRASRKVVLKMFSLPFSNEQFQIALKCVIVFVFVLFIDSVNRVQSISSELYESNTQGLKGSATGGFFTDRSEIQSRRFYAQRNMYLSGFTLFLTFVVTRIHALVDELVLAKDKVDHMNSNKSEKEDSEEMVKLKQELSDRNEYLGILKEKADALRNDYDSEVSRKEAEAKVSTKKTKEE